MSTADVQPAGLVVMYHYVRPDGEQSPAGIRPLRVNEFERQLDWLAERYEIVTACRFLECISGIRASKPPCLLTFDDGTKDHATVVTPILKRRGLSGVFFVLTWPMELGRMPLTHAVHWMLSRDEAEIWQQFESYARVELGGAKALGDEREARRIYHYETPLRARIKYAANMALPAQATERIVERAAQARGQSMTDLAREWFCSADDIRHMYRSGMTIAIHGCSHQSVQALGADGIGQEIYHAANYVEKLIGQPAAWFACPFGGSGASGESLTAMHDAMNAVGIRAAVTTQKARVLYNSDWLALPRIDCIDLPPRQPEPMF